MRLKAIILSFIFLFIASAGSAMAKRQHTPGAIATGGLGSDDGLGNQGGLILSLVATLKSF